jgi:outer membrane protein assembly factor BamD
MKKKSNNRERFKKEWAAALLIFLSFLFWSDAAFGFWIWTPKSRRLVNAKIIVKDTPEEQFAQAKRSFDNKEYNLAAEEFLALVEHYKDSDRAPEAQYYAGRSYEEAGKYYAAFQNYQKTLDTYPFTERINEIIERQYGIGKILYKEHRGTFMGKELMTDLDRAAEIFRTVRDNAPFGEYAARAQLMIGQCYKKSEQYNEAIASFQKIVDDYPKSKLASTAQYEVAQCTYLASLKPAYDQELTDDAIKEFKRIAQGEEDFDLSQEAAEVISLLEDKKAESLYKTAQFYEKRRRPTSAAIYYKQILSRYPESFFSELAAERLKDIDRRLGDG